MTDRATPMGKLATYLSACTLAWVAVYAPLETHVTWSIAGLRGFLYSAYLMNVVGMALMLWGAVAMMKRRPTGPRGAGDQLELDSGDVLARHE